MEWIEENGWEQTRGRRRGMDLYRGSRGETVIDYGIVNEEAWKRVPTRIQNRRKSRVGPSPTRNKYRRNEPLRKGKRKSKRGAEESDNKNMG
jgi:hypothetical protein